MAKIRNKSNEANGASAIAHELDTANNFTTAGAKLLSVKNFGVEKIAFDKDGNFLSAGANSTWVVRPEEGSAGIQAAMDAASAAGGGLVQLLEGTYSITANITNNTWNNVELRGMGDSTILEHSGFGLNSTLIVNILNSGPHAGNNVVAEASSVFTTTAANAGNYLAGDILTIYTTVGDPDGFEESEIHEVAVNGNAGTGEIQLKTKVQRTLTSITLSRTRNGLNNKIRDLKFTFANSTNFGAMTLNGHYSLIENVTVVGGNSTGTGQIGISGANSGPHSSKNVIRNCRMRDCDFRGIFMQGQHESVIENCVVENVNRLGTAFTYALVMDFDCRDCSIRDNIVRHCIEGGGIITRGTQPRRTIISNNKVFNIYRQGISGINCQIVGNYVEDCGHTPVFNSGFGAGIIIQTNGFDNNIVANNIIKNCYFAIQVGFNAKPTVVSGNTVQKTRTGNGLEALSIDAVGCSVIGNVVTDTGSHGIYAARKGTTCIGNVVRNAGGNGLHIVGDQSVVSNNSTFNSTGAGLFVDNSTVDTIFMGNNCLGDGITVGTGTGNDFIGNKE